MAAIPHIQKQLQELMMSPPAGFRIEPTNNIYEWTVWFCGPEETPYAGGQYKSVLTFPKEFPMKPPEFRIVSNFWHPNVYPNGSFCISILHAPGEDDLNTEESAMMRWTPVRTIRSVLISIMSLFYDPDPTDSGAPANVDALVQFRKDRPAFCAKCSANAKLSLAQLPPDYIPPSMEEVAEKPKSWRHSGFDMDHDLEDEEEEEGYSSSQPLAGGRQYMLELQQLRSMEFAPDMSDEQLLAMLEKHHGEVANVILELSE